jgi:hypothetical protein
VTTGAGAGAVAGAGTCVTTGADADGPVGCDGASGRRTFRTITFRRTMRLVMTGRCAIALALGPSAGSFPTAICMDRPPRRARNTTQATAAVRTIVERSGGSGRRGRLRDRVAPTARGAALEEARELIIGLLVFLLLPFAGSAADG